jgi:hypothetical protein
MNTVVNLLNFSAHAVRKILTPKLTGANKRKMNNTTKILDTRIFDWSKFMLITSPEFDVLSQERIEL